MNDPVLTHVMPNEQWHLVLEFGDEHRLFDASIARLEKGWAEFAYPDELKNLRFDPHGITWPGGRALDAGYLHAKSRPIGPDVLERQALRLGYRNQAPTAAHPSHHVYGVYLYPYGKRPFEAEQSIGGGHAEQGGARSYSLVELLAWAGWTRHFELSGCAWAVPPIQAASEERALLRALVEQACHREGAGAS